MFRIDLALFLVVVWTWSVVDCSPQGPPVMDSGLCPTMIPRHGASRPQTSPFPYTLSVTLHKGCYTPGKRLTVTLSGIGGAIFRGFFVQARKPENTEESFGTFDMNNDTDIQAIDCFGEMENAVGHTNSKQKITKTFGWRAPKMLNLQYITFVSSVVRDYSTFWMGIRTRIEICSDL